GDGDRKAGLRAARSHKVFNPWPVIPHRGRDENRSGHAGLLARQISRLDKFFGGQLVRQRYVRWNERPIVGGRHEAKSWRKCFSTSLTGFIAACPNPQIDASPITFARSVSNASSQCGSFISATAFSVPTRHGVHCPQLSSSDN